jgi:hypothetical protein
MGLIILKGNGHEVAGYQYKEVDPDEILSEEIRELREELSEVLASSFILMPEIEENRSFRARCCRCGWEMDAIEASSYGEASRTAFERHDKEWTMFAPPFRCHSDLISITLLT